MAEQTITYEALFDILRRERNREDIQTLDATFFQDVLSFIAEKLVITAGPLTAESERVTIQLQNVRKILKELYDRREKKIITLALHCARTGTPPITTNLLPTEKSLLEDMIEVCQRARALSLEPVLGVMTPSHQRPSYPSHTIVLPQAPPAASRPTPIPLPTAAPRPVPAVAPSSPAAPLPPVHKGPLKIRFLKAVPRFAGPDEQVFGPFIAGDETELPGAIADVLLRKGRAEQC